MSMLSRRNVIVGAGSALIAHRVPQIALADEVHLIGALGEGGDSVHLMRHIRNSGLTYIVLHSDEVTARRAGSAIVDEHGGRLFYLLHGGGRNIAFMYRGIRYAFDPNRIFSDAGIWASLRFVGRAYSEESHVFVREFAEHIMKSIEVESLQGEFLIGLHNSTRGGYSIESYARGGTLSHEARDVHINDRNGRDDFFFVTARAVFTYLRSRNYNVALQSDSPHDDGSLSVYCARHGISYINVETLHGHLDKQIEMIRTLADMES